MLLVIYWLPGTTEPGEGYAGGDWIPGGTTAEFIKPESNCECVCVCGVGESGMVGRVLVHSPKAPLVMLWESLVPKSSPSHCSLL